MTGLGIADSQALYTQYLQRIAQQKTGFSDGYQMRPQGTAETFSAVVTRIFPRAPRTVHLPRLTEIESSFRVMESDLGLRPLYHARDDRIEGHMLITVLAYHVAHLVRTCLKEEGFHQSWDTIRKELNRVKRITTVLPMSQMRSLVLNVDQNLTPLLEQIFHALGYRYDPKATRTKEVYQKPKNVPPKPPDS